MQARGHLGLQLGAFLLKFSDFGVTGKFKLLIPVVLTLLLKVRGLTLGKGVGPRWRINVGGLNNLALVREDGYEGLHPIILQLFMLLG